MLASPAEISNTTYRIIIELEVTILTYSRRSRRGHDYKERLFNCFQLTHVNRQIRNEFLPLYFEGQETAIRFVNVATYVRTFLAPRQYVTGSITLDSTGTDTYES